MNIDKFKLHNFSDLLDREHGEKGTPERADFDKKALLNYYGEVLKDRRKSLHITQKTLAEKTGLKRSYIARIERGETDMRISSLFRIAGFLGVDSAFAI
jgi:ribosome-binding protein aMBF1 (putative translation factor)